MIWKLDPESAKILATVKPELQAVIQRAVQLSPAPFGVAQGLRTASQQKALYAQGRTRKGPIVTWTLKSNHMSGRAIDFVALTNGKKDWAPGRELKVYGPLAAIILHAGHELKIPIRWGYAMWHKDYGHIELA